MAFVGATLLTPLEVLAAGAAASNTHTGNTNETALATISIPAGLLGANGFLIVWFTGTHTNNGNNKTWRVKLGSTNFGDRTETTTASTSILRVISNRNGAAAQVSHNALASSGLGSTTGAVTTGTENTATALTLTITAQLGNAGDSMTLESYVVLLGRRS